MHSELKAITPWVFRHYHLQVQANPKKIGQKKKDCFFLASMGDRDYAMTFFLNFHLGLSRSLRSKFGNHS